ncbi:MAG: hypothetical protein A4E28_02991 [Methanocella sp. PtaU1.Bin125]|nr:MAG: hypothetical protein A4E28_02991 [Methanocella sp. PtaU1.Bin125]
MDGSNSQNWSMLYMAISPASFSRFSSPSFAPGVSTYFAAAFLSSGSASTNGPRVSRIASSSPTWKSSMPASNSIFLNSSPVILPRLSIAAKIGPGFVKPIPSRRPCISRRSLILKMNSPCSCRFSIRSIPTARTSASASGPLTP